MRFDMAVTNRAMPMALLLLFLLYVVICRPSTRHPSAVHTKIGRPESANTELQLCISAERLKNATARHRAVVSEWGRSGLYPARTREPRCPGRGRRRR